MSHQTNVINAPVTMPSDMAAILSISGTDLQANCQAQQINMWAKYKPIQYSQVTQLSDSRRASLNYGLINIPTWGNINKMINFWLGIDTSSTNYPDCGIQPIYWGYNRPSSYFRLSDFSNEAKTLGYLHSAEAPIGQVTATSYTIDSSGHLRIIYSMGAQDSRTIALGDLSYPRNLSKSVGNMYFGVILYNTSTGTKYAVTQSTTVSQMSSYGAYVDINGLSSSFNGTYKVFPFISADQISFTSSLGGYTNGDFIALQEPETISVGSTIIRMSILEGSLNAYRDISQSTRNLYVNITLVNDSYQGNLGASVLFEIFNSASGLITSATRTVSGVGYNSSQLLSTAIDMESLTNLNAAYSVRATVTPTSGINVATTTAICTVTTGPSPY